MARGNGKQSQAAQSSGKLSAFVKSSDGDKAMQAEGTYVNWGEVNSYYMVGAIRAAVKEGGALLFGCSRDKSAYSVKVYNGLDGTAYYFPCTPNGLDDLEKFLLAIAALADET